MPSLLNLSKSNFQRKVFLNSFLKTKINTFSFGISLESSNFHRIIDKSIEEIKLNKLILPEEKTRKEEIIFYIMHDKYCQKPNKEYRIRHTTLERTELINKSKDLYVVYYGNF